VTVAVSDPSARPASRPARDQAGMTQSNNAAPR
jgi:hypothetical protein